MSITLARKGDEVVTLSPNATNLVTHTGSLLSLKLFAKERGVSKDSSIRGGGNPWKSLVNEYNDTKWEFSNSVKAAMAMSATRADLVGTKFRISESGTITAVLKPATKQAATPRIDEAAIKAKSDAVAKAAAVAAMRRKGLSDEEIEDAFNGIE